MHSEAPLPRIYPITNTKHWITYTYTGRTGQPISRDTGKIRQLERDQIKNNVKPHSHRAGVATVHPDAGQPVYRDAPGHIS